VTRPPARRLVLAAAQLVLPLAAFLVLRSALGDSTRALAITEAIPTAWLVLIAVKHRRVDPIVLLAVTGFGIALAVTALSGGSGLPLKLRRGLFPGVAGLACLISVAIDRPLLIVLALRYGSPDSRAGAKRLSHRDPESFRRIARAVTAILGFAFAADAGAQVALALTVSTAAFLGLARVATYSIIGVGVLASLAYLRFSHPRDQAPFPR
jgi:hypothetical protein